MLTQQQTSLKSQAEYGRTPFCSRLPVVSGRLFALPPVLPSALSSALLPVLLLCLFPSLAAAQKDAGATAANNSGPSGAASAASDQGSLNALVTHRHEPIVVRSKPVIERLPVKVIQPVDLKVSSDGRIFVADTQAGCVFRLDPDGQVSLAARDLAGIRRIQLDADGSLYVLTVNGAESRLYQATPAGLTVQLHTLQFPAISFTRNALGEFLVGQLRQLWQVGTDGQQTMLCRLPVPLVDLCSGAADATVALLQDGRVCQVGVDGSLLQTGQARSESSRLLAGTGGRFVTLATAAKAQLNSGLALYYVSDVSVSGQQQTPADRSGSLLASVPAGTQAAGLDPLGNLCLANPDLKAVTRVTTRFLIPCPHCGQQTLMIFDQAAGKSDSSSF